MPRRNGEMKSRKEVYVDEYKKLRQRFMYLVIAGICSFFIVPAIIAHITWGIRFEAFDHVLDLDPFILWVLVMFIMYLFLRTLFHFVIKKS